jgi:hypothetical protein
MKRFLNSSLTLLTIVFFVACSQKTAPTAHTPPMADSEYDGPRVTYQADIVPLMQRSCSPCHYPEKSGRKEPLDNYAAVKDHALEILERVQLPQSSLKFMPYEKKKQPLSAEEVELFKNWARGGFLES